jgi:hemoglobin
VSEGCASLPFPSCVISNDGDMGDLRYSFCTRRYPQYSSASHLQFPFFKKGRIMSTLYERLGGAVAISKMVDDIVEAHLNNPVIKARFLPYLSKPERVAEVKTHMCNFLGAGSGGPEKYAGRSMVDSHRGMNINEAEYMAAVDDIMAVMERHEIDESARKDVLAITFALKGEIIRQ